MGPDATELYRLRDRQGKLEREAWKLEGRIESVEKGNGELRDLVHVLRRDHDELEERVDGMTTAEKIATGVAQGIARERRARWTLARRAAAGFAGAVVLVPALHDLIAWLVT